MAYINREDFYPLISKNDLDAALDAEYTRLDEEVSMAQDEVASYLRSRYRIASEFRKEGEQRNRYIMMVVMDCALYHLFTTIAGRLAEEDIRAVRYAAAVKWLREVANGDLTAGIPTLSDPEGGSDPEQDPDAYKQIRWNSWQKMRNDY
nr:MAG TPA: head to tail adaptor [Caudoviricetes sp.]